MDAYIIVDGQRARIRVTSYRFEHAVEYDSVDGAGLVVALRELGPSTTVCLEGVVVEWADEPEPRRARLLKPKSAWDRLLADDVLEEAI